MMSTTTVDSEAWLRELRHRILHVLLGTTVAAGTLGLVFSVWRVLSGAGDPFTLPIYAVAYGIVLFLFLARPIPDHWRAGMFLAGLYLFACFALYAGWLASGGRPLLLSAIVGATVLLGPRAGLHMAGLSMATYVAFGVAFHAGWLTLRPLSSPILWPPIVTEGFGFVIAIGITAVSVWFIRQAMSTATDLMHFTVESSVLLDERARQLDSANRLLAERSRSLEAANEALEAEMQLAAAQVDLNKVLRGESGLATLADGVVRFLCRQIQAPVGALYVHREGVLELAGSYACIPGMAPATRFRLGEGLVGQAAVEKRPARLRDLPAGYLTIASGLGDARPDQVAIWPLVLHGEIMGIIELGLLGDLAASQERFLERVAESIAVALHTAQARARIDELLARPQVHDGSF